MSAPGSQSHPLPADEDKRLDELARYSILETLPEADYDHIVELAAHVFDVPVAMVSFIDRTRHWIKAKRGISATEFPRAGSLCAHTILGDELLVVPDALQDPRFSRNPFVLGEPRIRFYAGAPLVTPSGHKIGSLCVLGDAPRPRLTEKEEAALRGMAQLVMDRLQLRRLKTVERMATNIAGATPDAIICTDGAERIVFWNDAATRIFGYNRREALGRPLTLVLPERMRALHEAGLRDMADASPAARATVERRAVRKDGTAVPVELSIALWAEGEEAGFGAIIRDVSERRRGEEKLTQLAHFDPLTGLPNRAKLRDELERRLAPKPNGEPCAMSLALIDLDGFSDVNDMLGHSIGDGLLKAAAGRIAQAADAHALVARLGADEFVVAAENCADPCCFVETAERLLISLAKPVEIEGHRLEVRASIGLVFAPAHGRTANELLANADLALSAAKAAGGRGYRCYAPTMRAEAQAKHALEGELRRAFAAREFELFYQPQVQLADGAIVGAEALLRWRHPERGLVAPAAFIDALGASVIAPDVGQWVMEQACAQTARWQRAGLPIARVGVNLFAAQFNGGALVRNVERALTRAGLAPEALELEITENIALGHEERTLAPLRALRAMGVGLAFDDFGTGYAALSYLKLYPLSRVKIDRSFVRDVLDDCGDAAIVRSIITMSRSLALEVTAEGVESEAQEAFLEAEQCGEAQGYLYGKPMGAQEFEDLLRQEAGFGAPAQEAAVRQRG
jgi:diguanylate cyclase (GGDEF)-like protein/PAS domain S-box-containing protein